MLVGTDDGAIDEMHVPIELAGGIGLLLQGVKPPLKDAGVPPPVEAAGYHAPGAIALRQVVPAGATERRIHNMPLRMRRWAPADRAVWDFLGDAVVGAARIGHLSGLLCA